MKGVQTASAADLGRSQITVKGKFDPVALVEYIYKKTNKRAMIVKVETEKTKQEKDVAEAEPRRKQEANGVPEIKKEKKTTRPGMIAKTALPEEEEGKVIEKFELMKKQGEAVAAAKVERKPSKHVMIAKPESEKKQDQKVIGKTEPEKNGEQGVAKARHDMKREEKKDAVGFTRTKSEKKDEMIGSMAPKHATRTKTRKEQDKDTEKIQWEVKREENYPARAMPPLKEEEEDTAKPKTGKGEVREKIIEVVESGKIGSEMEEKNGNKSVFRQKAVDKGDKKEKETELNPAKVKPAEGGGTKMEAEQKENVFYEDIPNYSYSYRGEQRNNYFYQNPYRSSYAYPPQTFSDENPNAWCSIQ